MLRRLAYSALIAMIILELSASTWILYTRTRSTPVSLAEATESFRRVDAAPPPRPSTERRDRPRNDADAASAGSPPDAVARAPESVARPPEPVALPPGSPESTASPSGMAGGEPPSPGVYVYDTTGEATVSTASARHRYPRTTQATVRALAACEWSFEHTIVKEVVDVFEFCTRDGTAAMLRWRLERSFLGLSSVYDFVCGQPAVVLSDVGESQFQCDARNATATGTVVRRGTEELAVGSSDVETEHVTLQGVIRGDFEGEFTLDLWLAADTGLRIREVRKVVTRQGPSRYEEMATFSLTALEPRR